MAVWHVRVNDEESAEKYGNAAIIVDVFARNRAAFSM
jgi:hypothetical protein